MGEDYDMPSEESDDAEERLDCVHDIESQQRGRVSLLQQHYDLHSF